jgi:hypothetical protein
LAVGFDDLIDHHLGLGVQGVEPQRHARLVILPGPSPPPLRPRSALAPSANNNSKRILVPAGLGALVRRKRPAEEMFSA